MTEEKNKFVAECLDIVPEASQDCKSGSLTSSKDSDGNKKRKTGFDQKNRKRGCKGAPRKR